MEDINTKFFQFHSFSILSPPILLQPSNPQIREYFNQRDQNALAGLQLLSRVRPRIRSRSEIRLDSTRLEIVNDTHSRLAGGGDRSVAAGCA